MCLHEEEYNRSLSFSKRFSPQWVVHLIGAEWMLQMFLRREHVQEEIWLIFHANTSRMMSSRLCCGA